MYLYLYMYTYSLYILLLLCYVYVCILRCLWDIQRCCICAAQWAYIYDHISYLTIEWEREFVLNENSTRIHSVNEKSKLYLRWKKWKTRPSFLSPSSLRPKMHSFFIKIESFIRHHRIDIYYGCHRMANYRYVYMFRYIDRYLSFHERAIDKLKGCYISLNRRWS